MSVIIPHLPYIITGEVVKGKGLGRTVGMPTANIACNTDDLLPYQGVYASVTIVEEKRYIGLTSIGKRPSVDDLDDMTVENYLFDFMGNIYGKVVTIELHHYLRSIMRFSGLDKVKEQVVRDSELTRKLLM